MSLHRAGHDPRCERSKTSPRNCRCNCKGVLHGIETVRTKLALDEQTQGTALKEVRT